MKFSSILGVAVMASSVVGFATATVEGAKAQVIAALQAREVPANEIKAFFDLVARDTVTVTTSVDCGAYGYTTASYGPPTSASVPGTSGTETPPPATTGAETPTPAVPSSLSVTTTTTLTPETATTETPTAPPAVPGTTFVGSNTPVNTPPVFGSTGVNTLTTSGVTETTSSLTTETTGVTLSTTSARITPSTTTPPAPNNNAGATSGIHVGLLGLVAVLALA